MDIWLWKVGVTPWKIRHSLRDGQFSTSGAVESLQARLPYNTTVE